MKKRFGIFMLFAVMFTCLTFGLVSCNGSEGGDEEGRVNPMIVIETDKLELALDIWESDYTMPFAGVYYENLDRVDGKEIRMSLREDFSGEYIFEDILEYRPIRFPSLGKYELIYRAEGCQDAVITIYICERLEMDDEFTLENGTLTWEAVDGAIGYEVTVNGETPVFTETASFTSEIFAQQGFYVGVTAKGDNKSYIDSYMVSYENRIPLVGGEIAAFNNPCYELDIGPAKPSELNAPPEQIEYLTEEECAGSTGGAVKMLLKSGEYGPALFRVYLEEKIDKNEDFDGMEIRFKLDSNSYIHKPGQYTTRLVLAYPNADARPVNRGMYVYEEYNDSWQIVKIPKSVVDGFHDFDFLQFSLFNMVRTSGKGNLYLDYIRLYKDEIGAPTNVAIDGDKLNWDDVEDAYEYMISVDKTGETSDDLERAYFYTTESEIALTELGIDATSNTQQYELKVMAVSADTSIGSSAWSEKVVKRAEIANGYLSPMDNALYTLDVTNALTHTHMYWKTYEEVQGAEGGTAIHMALNADSDYGTISCFTINLPKALDLSDETSSLALRFKLDETNYTSLDTLTIQLVGKNANENYGSGTLFRQAVVVGEWMEYRLSMDDLKTYYETGDTQLSFQITNSVPNKSGSTVYMTVALDSLRYHKTVAVPANVRVEGTTLKWDAVADASGYTVNVNGEEHSGITETSYDLSALTDLNTVKVLAESANAEKGSSSYSAAVYYQAVAANVIASFNNASYVSSISNVAGFGYTVGQYPYNGEPAFETNVAGTVYFRVFNDDYRTGLDSSWTNLAAFTVTLPNAINLNSGYDGIKIRLQVKVNRAGSATLEMLAKGQNTSWNQNPSPVKVTVEDGNTAAVWVELSVTNEQLATLGYATGDTVLTFGIRNSGKGQSAEGYNANVSIDYIEYYSEEE